MPTRDFDPLTRAMLIQLNAEVKAHGYTSSSLARALKLDRNTFGRWMNGERAMSLPTFVAVLNQLGVDPATFMARARDRMPAADDHQDTPSM